MKTNSKLETFVFRKGFFCFCLQKYSSTIIVKLD